MYYIYKIIKFNKIVMYNIYEPIRIYDEYI
jgi:hypothetical protein